MVNYTKWISYLAPVFFIWGLSSVFVNENVLPSIVYGYWAIAVIGTLGVFIYVYLSDHFLQNNSNIK